MKIRLQLFTFAVLLFTMAKLSAGPEENYIATSDEPLTLVDLSWRETRYQHVFVIVEENHGYDSILQASGAQNLRRLAQTYGNAIAAASTPHWHAFFDKYPWTMLEASGEDVGLPKGIMGNSEVGHMNMGSGRVVPQGVVIIDADIASGEFAKNATLSACIDHVKRSGGMLHFMGLRSDGKVHSSLDHLLELMAGAHAGGAPFAIHAFLDGRDTPPRSAAKYLQQIEERLAEMRESGAIKSIIGRFYAMDRDKRWERTQLAYDALTRGQGESHAATAREAREAADARGENA